MNILKKGTFAALLLFILVSLRAGPVPVPLPYPTNLTTPVEFSIHKKATSFYLPSACSGLINDAVAGDGELSLMVQGRIHSGQLSVQVKLNFNGKAITAIGGNHYTVLGSLTTFESRTMASEPVDIFIKGLLKLAGKEKEPALYIGDIGFITVYPDGSVVNHLFDGSNNPEYSHPKVFCTQKPTVQRKAKREDFVKTHPRRL